MANLTGRSALGGLRGVQNSFPCPRETTHRSRAPPALTSLRRAVWRGCRQKGRLSLRVWVRTTAGASKSVAKKRSVAHREEAVVIMPLVEDVKRYYGDVLEGERKACNLLVSRAQADSSSVSRKAMEEVAYTKFEAEQALDKMRQELEEQKEQAEAQRRLDIDRFGREIAKVQNELEEEREIASGRILSLEAHCKAVEAEADDRVRQAKEDRDRHLRQANARIEEVQAEMERRMAEASADLQRVEARMRLEVQKAQEEAAKQVREMRAQCEGQLAMSTALVASAQEETREWLKSYRTPSPDRPTSRGRQQTGA